MSEPVRIVGQTEDGTKVLGGAYYMWETHGLPLDVFIDSCKAKGHIADIYEFALDAVDNGMKPRSIVERILAAVGDTEGDIEKTRNQLAHMGLETK